MPHITRPVSIDGLPLPLVETLAQRLERVRDGIIIDRAELAHELLSLLEATGTADDGSEGAKIWAELVAALPGHRALERDFLAVAEADDPIDDVTKRRGKVYAELNGMIRTRWTLRRKQEARNRAPSLGTIVWTELAASEQDEIRTMARELAQFHRSCIRAHRLHRDDIATLVDGLALIFMQQTGYPFANDSEATCRCPAGGELEDGGADEVKVDLPPHAVDGHFIIFAREALAPFFDPTEVSGVALSGRWKRMKRRGASGRVYVTTD